MTTSGDDLLPEEEEMELAEAELAELEGEDLPELEMELGLEEGPDLELGPELEPGLEQEPWLDEMAPAIDVGAPLFEEETGLPPDFGEPDLEEPFGLDVPAFDPLMAPGLEGFDVPGLPGELGPEPLGAAAPFGEDLGLPTGDVGGADIPPELELDDTAMGLPPEEEAAPATNCDSLREGGAACLRKYRATGDKGYLCCYYRYMAAYYCCIHQATGNPKALCYCYRFRAAFYCCQYQLTGNRSALCQCYRYRAQYFCCWYRLSRDPRHRCLCWRWWASHYCCRYRLTGNPADLDRCRRYQSLYRSRCL